MPVDSSELISKPKLNSSGFRQSFRITIWVSISVILLLGFLGLSVGVFGIKILKSVMPNWEPMKIITAICLIFAGASMIFLQLNRPSIINKIIPRLLATIISLICLVTIYNYIYLINTGNDSSVTQISFLKFFLGLTSRMTFFSACNLFVTGLIILLLSADNKRASDIAHILIIPVVLISYYVIASYILGVYSVTEIKNVPVPLNTWIAFCCICVAALLMKPNTWLLKVYTSSDSGGTISRRLLPPLIILPVVIGWLRIKGERTGLEEGVILVAIEYSISLLILIWLIARYMNKVDRDKYTSAKALLESEERFKAMAEASPVGMEVIKMPEGVFLYLNPSYEQYFGYDKDELLGKNAIEIYQDIKDRDFIYEKLNGNDYVSNYEVRLKRKDGSSFWSILSIRPIVYNGQSALLGTFVDITRRKSAEEALKVSEQKLKYHFENSPLAVVEWDKEYNIIQWSHEAERIFGWKSEEVLGKTLLDLNLVYVDDIPIVNRTMERLNSGKELILISSNRNLTKSGEVIECIWYNSVLVDENNHMSSVISLIQNVTLLKKTERELIESKDIYKELVTNAKSIISRLDRNGIITFINEFGQDFFGFTEKELLGRTPTETIVPKIESTGRKMDEIAKEIYEDPDKFSIHINENVKKNGERVWIEWHNKALFDKKGGNVGLLAVGLDITERRKAEIELNDSKAQLLELIATKDKFFNIVAHDLKNPFTSLLGSSELLYKNIHQMEEESIRELALILNDSAKGGYAILQNLLDWSRSQTGLIKYKPERILLNDIIKDNISNLQLQASVKEINLYNNTKEKIIIVSDKNMINTVVRNLLGNALKYTHRRGSVFVKANIKTGEVQISVKDTGIGISKEEIEKLFRLDTKFSNPGTANELGTGLGLKLCREFAEKMGGSIHVESTPNEGSNFVLSIPVK